MEFVCLTNENIGAYLEIVPTKVEEITFWNYRMCLDPNNLPHKDVLVIPSLERFTDLKCVKFYNERIEVEVTLFPPTVERVFFISCVVKNQWLNVCVYRKNLKHIDQYYSSFAGINHVLGFLQQPSATSPFPTAKQGPPSLVRRCSTRRQKSVSIWKRILESFCSSCPSFFTSDRRLRRRRISPEKESTTSPPDGIELSDFVPLYQPTVEMPLVLPILEIQPATSIHTFESIYRLKKTYDILVNENIIRFLIGD
jgi:hypothetical protein